MDNTSWEQKLHALTHILTSPTHAPPLHSQLFIATQIPCYLNWNYPPLLCRRSSSSPPPPPLMRWALSQFIKRGRRLGLPETSWRCKCPYQLPPPLILAKGVAAGEWGEEERRRYVRSRLRRRRLVNDVNPLIPILVPNLLVLLLLFWVPISLQDN
ncbi:uncharacterized protein LOC125213626 [Salvia hispanica]|uniref:uncharacterized protein LOC125213626 n=1 Tax=Salvia hispanica TaxID=49212 RepID=UPI0020092643|nr:uncharacterized protein LOC125213626 [Salvia hispanica]